MDARTRSIGSYRLIEPLGSGGMGVVYRAVHENGQIVALKTVRLAAESQLAGLRREIHALARLRHPGIVRIIEEGVAEGLPWYAMELLEGHTLRRHVEDHALGAASTGRRQFEAATTAGPGEASGHWWTRTLDRSSAAAALLQRARAEPAIEAGAEAEAAHRGPGGKLEHVLGLMRRLCAPLAYLHGEGLVHRDLKLENVLLRPDGRPVLVDFGLAAQFSGEVSREALASASFAGGTVYTMSPEQIRGELVDARADLYALGCILYELLTGRPPFSGQHAAHVLWQHLNAEPERPSELVPDVPEALDVLVLRLLAKQPRERFGHADDVATALGRLGAEHSAAPGSDLAPERPRPRAYLYRPSFAGREEALAELEPHLDRLEAGGGALVLLGGPSGIGKTRLLLELARRGERRQFRVSSGECVLVDIAAESSAARSSAALQPMRGTLQAVADLCRERGREQTERLLGARGMVLALYEPALRALPGQARYPELVELPADTARLRLYSALAETLRALAEEQPLLLVLDDLQWADELTLGFLGYLARSALSSPQRAARFLVVGAYRTEETGETLRALLEQPGVRQLQLGRLHEQAIGQIVCDMLALEQSPPVFTRYLSRQSEGNPFFVAEYLRTAVREGLLWRDGSGLWKVAEEGQEGAYERLPLPPTVRDLVARHLERLGGSARRLVDAASVLGKEVEGSLLASVSGLGALEVLEGTLELLGQQVLEEAAPGRLRFAHDKLREVAYEQLGQLPCIELHRTAAETLEALGPDRRDESLAELGYHWGRAGVSGKARECYIAAARIAASRYAHAEAERLYRAYLGLAEQPSSESIQPWNQLVIALRLQGRASEALEEAQRVLEAAIKLGDRAAEGQCRFRLGILQHDIGRRHDAEAAYNQALAIARETGSLSDQANALNSLGLLHSQHGRLEEAHRLYQEALSILRKSDHRPNEGSTLNNFGIVYLLRGELEAARQILEQTVALVREVGDRVTEGSALSNLARVHLGEGRQDRAEALYLEALAIHRDVGNRRSEGITLGNLASLRRMQGRVDEGWALLQQALVIHREVGNRSFEAELLREATIFKRQCHGSLDEALGFIESAEDLLGKIGDTVQSISCLCERGHLALARGCPAHELVEQIHSRIAALAAAPESEPVKDASRLQRAQEAFEAGRHELLFRGELIEDLSEGLRRWLVQTGQLPLVAAMLSASEKQDAKP
jgi:eukaryotic-like serine/threonine-protein kinase